MFLCERYSQASIAKESIFCAQPGQAWAPLTRMPREASTPNAAIVAILAIPAAMRIEAFRQNTAA
jgi:hypothetical protein